MKAKPILVIKCNTFLEKTVTEESLINYPELCNEYHVIVTPFDQVVEVLNGEYSKIEFSKLKKKITEHEKKRN